MGKEIMTRAELAEKSGIEPIELDLWTKARILKPVGFAEDKSAFYAAADFERVSHVRKLRELGYGLEEIQKIIKKYGWPQAAGGEKKAAEKEKFLTVGQLAEKAGVSPRTIKHWEDVGILDPDLRSEGGFRLYDETYVFLCQLIRDLQLFGYSLEEIKAVSDSVRDFFSLEKDLTVVFARRGGPKARGPPRRRRIPEQKNARAPGGDRPLGGPSQEEKEGNHRSQGQKRQATAALRRESHA